jgi:hypothetical protein
VQQHDQRNDSFHVVSPLPSTIALQGHAWGWQHEEMNAAGNPAYKAAISQILGRGPPEHVRDGAGDPGQQDFWGSADAICLLESSLGVADLALEIL